MNISLFLYKNNLLFSQLSFFIECGPLETKHVPCSLLAEINVLIPGIA